MKIYNIVFSEYQSYYKTIYRQYFYWIDPNGILCQLTLRNISDSQAHSIQDPSTVVNKTELGYEYVEKMLNGTYAIDLRSRPRIKPELLIQSKELLGTDEYYQFEALQFLAPVQLRINRPHSLYGFRNADFIYCNPLNVCIENVENIYDTSFNTKRQPKSLRGVKYSAYAACPLTDSTPASNEFILAVTSQLGTRNTFVNIDNSNITQCTYGEFFNTILPSNFPSIVLTQESTDQDGVVTLKASCKLGDTPVANTFLYLSCDSGYLNKRKVLTDTQGDVTFKWSPMLLTAGDTCEIKCGFKIFTNLANIELTV